MINRFLHKLYMRSETCSVFAVLVMLLVVSIACKKELPKEEEAENPVEKTTTLRLRGQAFSGSSSVNEEGLDNTISRLRMIVFGAPPSKDKGELLLNVYDEGKSVSAQTTKGRRDIYIIANEPLNEAEEKDEFKNIHSAEALNAIEFSYTTPSNSPYLPTEIPMFRAIKDKLLSEYSHIVGDKTEEQLERLFAKVTVKLNVSNANFPIDKEVVIDNVCIKNLPKKHYLIAKMYDEELITSELQTASVTTPVASYDRSTRNTFYVPEYIVKDSTSAAYIEIKGHIQGSAKICSWKIPIGDAMDDNKAHGNRYDLSRNRHYTFTGNVKGYGNTDLDVSLRIAPWIQIDIVEESGNYIKLEEIRNSKNELIDINTGSSLITDEGEVLSVECRSRLGNWFVVLRDQFGNELKRSKPTPAITADASQTISITIDKLPLKNDTYQPSRKLSICVYPGEKWESLPEQIHIEVKVKQVGGFISTQELIEVGWSNNLPKKGLQIAKRGYGIFPNGTAESSDESTRNAWRSQTGITANTASDLLGDGVKNTNAMRYFANNQGAVTHPAANYCRSMGPDWYLPSLEELKMISSKIERLGKSYTFDKYQYWSSSELDAQQGKAIDFTNGMISNSSKLGVIYVRCVRNIEY